MTNDTIERRLADLATTGYATVTPSPDLARASLRLHRRHQRQRVLAAGLGVAVIAICVPLAVSQLNGHSDHAKLPPKPPTATSGHQPGRFGNTLYYAPGHAVRLTHAGSYTLRTGRLPAALGQPDGFVAGLLCSPNPVTCTEMQHTQIRPVITRRSTSLRATFSIARPHPGTTVQLREPNSRLFQGQGTVAGRFLALPPLSRPAPQQGTIRLRARGSIPVRAANTRGVDVTVGPSGRFTATLPAGTYRVTGVSPQYNSGHVPCRARHLVTISPHGSTHINVYCQEK